MDESGLAEDYPSTNENISTVVTVLAAIIFVGLVIYFW